MSREHYLSRAVFAVEHVTVEGMPGPAEKVPLHIDALVTNSLCEGHNNDLSQLDRALGDFVNCTRFMYDESVPLPQRERRALTIDAVCLERAILKTCLNYCRVQRGRLEGWTPPDSVARMVFGKEAIPDGCGLASLVEVGERIEPRESFEIQLGKAPVDGEYTALLLVVRRGYRLVCTWDTPLSSFFAFTHEEQKYLQAVERPNRLDFNDLRSSVTFDWSGPWEHDHDHNVAALRVHYAVPRKSSRRRSPK